MDNLNWPSLEKVLRYLTLEEVLELRTVSKGWRAWVDNFRADSLCYSAQKRGHIYGKHRLISGKFDRNFIGSTKFESFFGIFAKSIFSDLKHLRICNLAMQSGSPLVQALNNFRKLKELDLINLRLGASADRLQLNLPELQSIRIEDLSGIDELTVDAPQLSTIKLWICPLRSTFRRLNIIHVESVQHVVAYSMRHLDVSKFENLQDISWSDYRSAECLWDLKKLKEIHLTGGSLKEVFDLQEKYWEEHHLYLMVYFCGLQVDYHYRDMDRLTCKDSGDYFPSNSWISHVYRCVHSDKDPQKLADEFRVRYQSPMDYSKIEETVPMMPVDFWKRFANLNEIVVSEPIELKKVGRFLQFLENLESVTSLRFESRQPQDLYDRLPEHCAIQGLQISVARNLNSGFLCRLKHLINASVVYRVSGDIILRVFKELQFIRSFTFINRVGSSVEICLDESRRFVISVGGTQAVFKHLNKAFTPMNL